MINHTAIRKKTGSRQNVFSQCMPEQFWCNYNKKILLISLYNFFHTLAELYVLICINRYSLSFQLAFPYKLTCAGGFVKKATARIIYSCLQPRAKTSGLIWKRKYLDMHTRQFFFLLRPCDNSLLFSPRKWCVQHV